MNTPVYNPGCRLNAAPLATAAWQSRVTTWLQKGDGSMKAV
ncbi:MULTISPECIES: hypothetical protein [Sphingobium]|uniref:Uncharacterized protein n=1 Tax=Sphingobium fuliginis (strain ATCC 27551) TaxID=336203 RepID=A0A292ZKA8_SPHSA|nr:MULTISPECIES: hypothetical protein [Sphingobium]UXC90333.1 hypothetical protein EGM87_15020 [Sphingobium sp. RSMS]WDA36027.1 hypothetical protein PO876_21705 [Sphingobium sp. YC-XJ3]GAY23538.1 hypothetical protein SFOMI_4110 [Sphingobium fuliginis]